MNKKVDKNKTNPDELRPKTFKKFLLCPGTKKSKNILKVNIKKIALNIFK